MTWLKLRELFTIRSKNILDNKIDEHLFAVMNYLFGKKMDSRGVNNANSFSTYFSLRPFVNQVGWSDFVHAVNTQDSDVIKLKMKEWLDSPNSKIDSLYSRFKGLKIGKSKSESCVFRNYFIALQYWIDYKNDRYCKEYVPKIFKHIVDPDNCNDDMMDIVREKFENIMYHLLEKRENCFMLIKILTNLYPIYMDDDYVINDSIIKSDIIDKYIDETFTKFMESKELKIEDLCDKGSEIHELIMSAKIDDIEEIGVSAFFIFDKNLIKYFEEKPKKDSGKVLMEKFILNPELVENYYLDDVIREDLVTHINKYFISLYCYRNILRNCIAEDSDVVDKYLKANRIE